MTALYILDTDHLSFYGRNHPPVIARLQLEQGRFATTAINVEEQLRGRLAQVAQARDTALSNAYQRLIETMLLLSEFQILPYDSNSHNIYQLLKWQAIYFRWLAFACFVTQKSLFLNHAEF